MSTIKIFKNYGCLAAEKRNVYTYGTEQPTATCADEIVVKIPDGWKVINSENDILLESPWGWTYNPNDLLNGNEKPCFMGYDRDGRIFNIPLKVVEQFIFSMESISGNTDAFSSGDKKHKKDVDKYLLK